MRSYAQYCPVAKASEILGDRWTLLIVREMLGGASGFNELQRGLPRDLAFGPHRPHARARAGRDHRAEDGPQGPHARVSPDARRPRPGAGRAGDRRVGGDLVVHRSAPRGARSRPVDRLDGPPRRSRAASPEPHRGPVRLSRPQAAYWMVLEPSEVSVCLQHPGFDVDLEVTVDTTTLYRVYLGRAELGGAMRAGQLTMSGPRTLQRGFGRWFTWSAFAPASRSAAGAPHSRVAPRQPSSRTNRRRTAIRALNHGGRGERRVLGSF